MSNFILLSQNDDSGLCPSSGNFFSKEALNTDAKGNCELDPISVYPVPTVDDKDCDKNPPKLDVKIISVNKEELHFFFSNNGGETYYNEEEPRIAVRIPDADADGKNSGGSSSKGGKKKGTNDRRRKLVEKALKQAQRKLGWCDGTAQLGEDCESGFDQDLWCDVGLNCYGGFGSKKCYIFVAEYGYCGGAFMRCSGSTVDAFGNQIPHQCKNDICLCDNCAQ